MEAVATRTGSASGQLPAEFASLFWDCDLGTLDICRHRDQILERVLGAGTVEAVRWVLDTYGDETVREFVSGYGLERLSREALAFWYSYYDMGELPCMRKSSRTINASLWPY